MSEPLSQGGSYADRKLATQQRRSERSARRQALISKVEAALEPLIEEEIARVNSLEISERGKIMELAALRIVLGGLSTQFEFGIKVLTDAEKWRSPSTSPPPSSRA